MSQESQKLAVLRDQMDRIDEVAGLAKGALNVGKNFVSGLKGRGTVQPLVKQARGGSLAGKIAPGGRTANVAGKAVAANPVKAAGAAGVAAGAAGMSALSGGAATKPADADAPATATAPGTGKLTPEEQAEFNALIKEFDPMMGQSADLDALITQATKLVGGSAELDAIIKNAGVAKPVAAPAATTATTPAPGAATKPAATTTATNTNTQVSGNTKMGQPDGPIEFNGKTVNPGEPEYAAASAALMKSQDKMNTARTQRTTPEPVVPGAPNTTTTKSGVTVSNW